MNEKPLITVVILAYNHEKYIGEAIEGALNQLTDYEYEIIIGEDCSTDNTINIISNYQIKFPKKIKIVTSEKNVGLLKNFYRTVNSAKGKYIAGCGGDDFWNNPRKLQKQVEYLENHPSTGMVHSGAHIVNEFGEVKNTITKRKRNKDIKLHDTLSQMIAAQYPVFAPTAVFRKDLFDKYFNLDLLLNNNIIMEDTPLWIDIAAHENVYYFEECFLCHREVEGSISNPKNINKKIDFLLSSKICLEYYYDKYKMLLKEPKYVKLKMYENVNKQIAKIAFQGDNPALFRIASKNVLLCANMSSMEKLIIKLGSYTIGFKILNVLKKLYTQRIKGLIYSWISCLKANKNRKPSGPVVIKRVQNKFK